MMKTQLYFYTAFLFSLSVLSVFDSNAQRLNGSYSSNLVIDVSTLTFNDKKNTFKFSGGNCNGSFTGSGTYTTEGNNLFLAFDLEKPGTITLPRKPVIEKIADDSTYKVYLHLSENADTSKPVPHHSIVIKGTTSGTMADNNGNATIRSDKKILVLVISGVNSETEEIRLESPGVYHIRAFRFAISYDVININKGQRWALQIGKDGNNNLKLEHYVEGGTPRIYIKRKKRS